MPGDGFTASPLLFIIGHGLEQHELPGADVHQEEPAVAGLPALLAGCGMPQPFGNRKPALCRYPVTAAGVSQADQQLQATDGQRWLGRGIRHRKT